MEFTNDVLKKMEDKLKYNNQISSYFYKLFLDEKNNKYLNLSNNVKDCLGCWIWDKYKVNKVLDLQKVNRCKNRFCSNCRKWELSRALNNLSPHFKKLVNSGYLPLMLTLTVPNCSGNDISSVLDNMQIAFKKFYNWFFMDNKKGYSKRLVKFYACIKCIEITYNKINNTYHPHYHCLIFIDENDYNFFDFEKNIIGEYSNKRKSNNMYSILDMQIRKLWTLAYNKKTLRDFDKLDSIYIADIREMDITGIYEVMKYVFKDSDIDNYYIFRNFYFGLYGRRIRQGYGLLYNIKIDDDSDGSLQELEQFIKEKESPEKFVSFKLETLYNSYADYIKISRFNKDKFIDKLD